MAARKNILSVYDIISSGNMSVSSLTSLVTSIQYLDDVGIQFTWSGSPTGTFAVEVSADYAVDINGNVTNSGNWVPLTFTYWSGTAFVTAFSIPSSVGSPIYLDLALLSAPYIRAVYTKSAGSGTLQAVITAKQV